jgi:hypothetical protein
MSTDSSSILEAIRAFAARGAHAFARERIPRRTMTTDTSNVVTRLPGDVDPAELDSFRASFVRRLRSEAYEMARSLGGPSDEAD